jgi:hypothetical protein
MFRARLKNLENICQWLDCESLAHIIRDAVQAKRATEDLGKKLPGKGDISSAAKNAAPALPKVTPP